MAKQPLPRHIAIVMDGNGRWANKRFLPRIAGHRAGVDATRRIVKSCVQLGIEVLSLFTFSNENWNRPQEEVSALMELLFKSLEKEVPNLQKQNIQLRFIGNKINLNPNLQNKILQVETEMARNTGMVLLIALDYGGQWDICASVKQIAEKVVSAELLPSDISPTTIAQHLSFADLPDPDLFIRTSGEMRISNFMLWQLAYTELFFAQAFWPDFTEEDLKSALDHFSQRQRRFGDIKAKVKQ